MSTVPNGQRPQHLPAATGAPEHTGQAWLTNGMRNRPAVLRLAGDRLSLVVAEGVVFDERVADLDRIHVPWYWFSGGVVVTVRGRKQKIAFVRPEGAPDHDLGLMSLLNVAGLGAGVGSLVTGASFFGEAVDVGRGVRAALSIAPGRRAGKEWRALLGV